MVAPWNLLLVAMAVAGSLCSLSCEGPATAPGSPESSPVAAPASPGTAPEAAAPGMAPPSPTPPPPPIGLNVIGTVPLKGDFLDNQIVIFFDDQIVLSPGTDGSTPAPATVMPDVAESIALGENYISIRLPQPNSNPVYEVKLNPELRSAAGKAVAPEQQRMAFARTAFTAERLYLAEEVEGRTDLALAFNMPVSLNTLPAMVRVTGPDGTAVPFTVDSGFNPNTCRIALEKNERWPVKVTVVGGLIDTTGFFSTASEATFSYPVNESLQVLGMNVLDAGETVQTISVQFNADVTPEDLLAQLSVLDTDTNETVPVTVEKNEGEQHTLIMKSTLNMSERPNGLKFHVKIASGLKGEYGLSMAADYESDLYGYVQPLTLQSNWWEDHGRQGMAYHIYFSEAVDLESLRKLLTVSPALEDQRVEMVYSGQYAVYGSYRSKTTYNFNVAAGLKHGQGSTLSEPIVFSDTIDELSSYLGFGQEGKYYFPRRPGLTLSLESRNLKSAELKLHRLFPSNIAVALSGLNNGDGGDYLIQSWSEEVATKEVPLAIKLDQLTSDTIDLDALFPADKKGVFCLEARTNEGYRTATKVMLWTNIGLLSHWQDDGLVLFAHDLYSLVPLAQAEVQVFSTKNQLMGQAQTSEQGIVQFNAFEKRLGTPRVVVVQYQDDYTFLELEPREEEGVAFASDMSPYGRDKYDAFLYADRDLYRPGETAHLRWLVRQNYGDAVANVPLLVDVLKPNGKPLLSQATTLSAMGTGGLDLATQKAYPTGKYTVRLMTPGTAEPIGAYLFNLEEFVPNRLKSTVSVDAKVLKANTDYTISLKAEHLFGSPASGRQTEGLVLLQRKALETANWKAYRFENDSEFVPDAVQLGEGETDANGISTFAFKYTAPAPATSPMAATLVGRVFELGGRAVSGNLQLPLLPANIALGMSAAPAEGGRAIEVFAAAINADESPADLTKVSVTLEREEWNYYVRRYYSGYEPRWSKQYAEVSTHEVSLSAGKGSVVIPVPESYGYFRVRVNSTETPMFSSTSFYAYGTSIQMVDPSRPSLLKIALDKESYSAGETAQVRVESPFDGQGILVLQGEKLYTMVPVTIANGAGLAEIPITEEFFPNVWIEVTVVHAIQEGKAQVYPFSSAAAIPLKVNSPTRSIAVTFPDLPQEVRPAGDMQVRIETRDAGGTPVAAEITVAAVDEGIHSITSYKSPAPFDWLARFRKPDYRRTHYYDKVAYDFEAPRIGGDGDLAARIGAAQESWIRPVSLWTGVVQTDSEGKALVSLPIPEFTGQLRLVAVAASGTGAGAQSANFFVRRPYMMRTSLPRFVLPGDRFTSKVVLFNHSDAPCKVRVNWIASGALEATEGSHEVEITAKGEVSFDAVLAARDALGQGGILWEAVITDGAGAALERLVENDPLPVNPPAVYQTRHESAVVNAGETHQFNNTFFVENEQSGTEITVSANPLTRLSAALKDLVGYPYGCVEQTVSRLMPMYLLRQSEAVAQTAMPMKEPIGNYIQAGIARLFAMQASDGGLSFWPGAQTSSPYGSVYALHFLTMVKRDKSYALPEESFKDLQNYVRQFAYSSGMNAGADMYTRVYALFDLAMDGDLQSIQQIERFDDVAMPRAARYLLAGALAMSSQDTDRVKLYLAKAVSESPVTEAYGTTFGSTSRDTAVELLMLQRSGGDPSLVAEKANELLAFVEGAAYRSTQETAFAVAALSDYLANITTNPDQASAQIVAPGEPGSVAGLGVFTHAHAGPGGVYTVTNTGQSPIYVNVTRKGVPQQVESGAIKEGMALQRTLYTRAGEKAEATTYSRGDSFVVELALMPENAVEYVALSDLLPAGFEIENARLEADAALGDRFKDAAVPSYLEIRDDRIVAAFDALEPGTHRFYYVVRAVTPGKFTSPGAYAECMYDATKRASTEAGVLEVSP